VWWCVGGGFGGGEGAARKGKGGGVRAAGWLPTPIWLSLGCAAPPLPPAYNMTHRGRRERPLRPEARRRRRAAPPSSLPGGACAPAWLHSLLLARNATGEKRVQPGAAAAVRAAHPTCRAPSAESAAPAGGRRGTRPASGGWPGGAPWPQARGRPGAAGAEEGETWRVEGWGEKNPALACLVGSRAQSWG
jgi:hypothetical protein